MCRLCDRSWLGLRNTRWGQAHIVDNPRTARTWTRGYNPYHDPYMKRFRRNIHFGPKEDLRRYRWG